jgi:hypothetical protein
MMLEHLGETNAAARLTRQRRHSEIPTPVVSGGACAGDPANSAPMSQPRWWMAPGSPADEAPHHSGW